MPKQFSHFTDTLKFTVKISYRKNAENKWDFSLVLKVCREFGDLTSAGKLFHVRAAATGNAQSPTVDSRVGGTFNAEVDVYLRSSAGLVPRPHDRWSLSTLATSLYITDFGDYLSPKTATVAEKCDCRRIRRLSPLSRRSRRQSPFSATVALFCDSVDRALVKHANH